MASGCSRISRSIQWACGSGDGRKSSSGAVSTREMSSVVPSALTTPISPSCMAMKFLVCRLKAAVSDATKVLPGARPIVMGLPLHATTISDGSSAARTARPHVPSHFLSAVAVASLRLTFLEVPSRFCSSSARPMNCAMTSVSVSERSSMPRCSSSSRRSSAELVMTPLCATATRSAASKCGCAFSSVLPPCVAQRVCAMPACAPPCFDACCRTSSTESAVDPRDANFVTANACASACAGDTARCSVAMPAES
mmetsp:Transcript_20206/g.80659  ORF Transcript_20206/g.80659 Transcript_20206/m.80659 type:complete len:253 (-) Transcript_20206:258-1016(-)